MKIPIALAVLIAVVLGYMLGTENGRQQRDQLLERFRSDDDAVDAFGSAADSVADAVS